jgi:hypothetical protein
VPHHQLSALKKKIQVREGQPENFENLQGLACLFILGDLLTRCIHALCVTCSPRAVIIAISVLFRLPKFFHQAPHCHDISLNAKYLFALKNVRDRKQFAYIARQVLLEARVSLCDSYREATQNPHGYMILDFAQDTDDLLRFRTNVFADEYPPVIYARVNDEAQKIQLASTASKKKKKTTIKKSYY